MSQNTLLFAIVVVAVLALAGRILINRQKKDDTIGWGKLIAVFSAVVVFVVLFSQFDPHRFVQWWKGAASRDEARTECIAGRKAAKDISRFAGPSDDQGNLYYALQVKDLEPTGYYRVKTPYTDEAEVERSEAETESEHLAISRRTSVFPITRNPGENADKYLSLYLALLENKGSVLVALEEADANVGELPVAMMRSTDEKLRDIALKTDSTAIVDYYFVAFDESRYAHNATNYYIYKAIVGLMGAIVVALTYLMISLKRK